jgi:hypothetical protein
MEYLYKIKEEMEQISGNWNGKLPGLQEERAMWANEVIELVDKLIEKLNETI